MQDAAPALPAATVMLVRETPDLEVLMVRRHHRIDFASGALVFPGGKLDPSDRDPAWTGRVHGLDGLSDEERALRICAAREAFEESGILLARDERDAIPALGNRAAAAREAVATGKLPFITFMTELGLDLDLSAMTRFAHWITPTPLPKRFDTHFYLMAAPPDQVAACDGCETVDAEWIAPAEALRLGAAGERTIIFPTRLNLELLARSNSAAEAFAGAASRPIRTVLPEVVTIDGRRRVTIPDDAGYGAVGANDL
ncbi:NUDIX hydrolase [Enterovirga rhinocerotis]|uniref:NUDIX domain-containing protein n=1 Tax=Enterovirga rhinocerotis TaxID=1339210 RepID=A0A4V3DYT0_9HYPH|nr:NUDIX domain-containing protein [Enterovirga rhinocerotis]TDR93849.1 NUDIX domain-containing protein [Enterovirga rhinocerotis]